MLFACSRVEGSVIPTIQLQDANLAIRLNNWITRRMLQMADRHVSKSQFGQQVNEMRSLLRSKPGAWTLSEITRKTRDLRPKERIEILQTLVIAGSITQSERETTGRTATVFESVN
jgi:hypothetical protein